MGKIRGKKGQRKKAMVDVFSRTNIVSPALSGAVLSLKEERMFWVVCELAFYGLVYFLDDGKEKGICLFWLHLVKTVYFIVIFGCEIMSKFRQG